MAADQSIEYMLLKIVYQDIVCFARGDLRKMLKEDSRNFTVHLVSRATIMGLIG